MTIDHEAPDAATESWLDANGAYLDAQLRRIRLLLQRHVVWLRHCSEPDPLQSYRGIVISEAQLDGLLREPDARAMASFYEEDAEAVAIARVLESLGMQLQGHARAMIDLGRAPALESLGDLFGLNAFEHDVLLLCLAPLLDASFERLYAYIHDDVTRKYANAHLALVLPGSGPAAIESFLPEAPLRRYNLVVLDPGPYPSLATTSRPIHLDDRVAGYLLGINRRDERVSGLLRHVARVPLSADQLELIDQLYPSIPADSREGPLPPLNLIGPSGVGKRGFAAELSRRLGLSLHELDSARLPPAGAERLDLLRLLDREAVLLKTALYIDATANEATSLGERPPLDDLAELGAPLIVGSSEPWRAPRATVAVRVPRPSAQAQGDLWKRALPGRGRSLTPCIERVVQQFDFGPEAIAETADAARGRARTRLRSASAAPKVTDDDLWEACREHARRTLDELCQRIVSAHTWDDIVLPNDTYRQLREVADQVAHRARVYEQWGFGAKLTRGRGVNALFSGPSGTGKTMAAEILANHLELDLYRIDLSGVVSKYIGETEKNLRRVFETAEQSGAILFFDEADALFGRRTEIKYSHDRYANIEVSYLLQRMEDYRGLAVLATNMKSHLDQAFLRRLRFIVDFPFPDTAHRLRIWQTVFPGETPVESLDFGALGRLEIPGGNIRNIAVNAAFLAASQGGKLRMEHLMHAARREYAKIEKLVSESEFGPYYAVAR